MEFYGSVLLANISVEDDEYCSYGVKGPAFYVQEMF